MANSGSKKIYLHHESSDLNVTKVEEVKADSSLTEILESFAALINTHRESDPIGVSSIFLRRSNGKKLSVTPGSQRNVLDHIEDKEDIFVCASPTGAGGSDSNAARQSEIKASVVAAASAASPPPAPEPAKAAAPSQDANSRTLAKLHQYIKAKRYRQVRQACEEILRNSPKHDGAMLLLAEVSFATGRYEKAIDYCQKIYRSYVKSLDFNLLLAQAHLRAGNFEDALEAVANGKMGKSDNLTSTQLQDRQLQLSAVEAECVFELGNAQGGAELINKTMGNPRAESNVHILAAYSYFATSHRKVEEPMRALLKAITLDQSHKRVKEMLAELLQSDTGLVELHKQVPARPQSAPAFAFIATVAKEYSALKAALSLYETALKLNPTCANYALNAMHVQEVQVQYQAGLRTLLSFFRTQHAPASLGGETFSTSMRVILERAIACTQDMSLPEVSDPASADGYLLQWDTQKDCCIVHRDRTATSAAIISDIGSNRKVQYDGDELDWLALSMSAVKLLFLQGKLWAIPPILALLEPLRVASEEPLHLSSVRNEQAYYMSVAHILCSACAGMKQPQGSDSGKPCALAHEGEEGREEEDAQYMFIRWMLGAPQSPAEASSLCPAMVQEALSNPLFVVGDSHCLSPAWSIVLTPGSRSGSTDAAKPKARLLVPKLATGAKHWHLRREGKFYPKANFTNVVKTIPEGSDVLVVLGEIDCREGMLKAVEADKYDSIKDAMKSTAKLFVDHVLKATLIGKKRLRVLVHPVVPVLNETRSIVLAYNAVYKQAVQKLAGATWLNFLDELLEIDVTEGGPGGEKVPIVSSELPTTEETLRPVFKLDGTHLHPRYVALLPKYLPPC